VPKCFEIRV